MQWAVLDIFLEINIFGAVLVGAVLAMGRFGIDPFDLRGPIMGSLKSPCMTSYRPRSVMETHSSKLLRL